MASWLGSLVGSDSITAETKSMEVKGKADAARYQPHVVTGLSADMTIKMKALEQALAESEYEKGLLRYNTAFLQCRFRLQCQFMLHPLAAMRFERVNFDELQWPYIPPWCDVLLLFFSTRLVSTTLSRICICTCPTESQSTISTGNLIRQMSTLNSSPPVRLA